jgi:hypothetical protein
MYDSLTKHIFQEEAFRVSPSDKKFFMMKQQMSKLPAVSAEMTTREIKQKVFPKWMSKAAQMLMIKRKKRTENVFGRYTGFVAGVALRFGDGGDHPRTRQ